MARVTVATSATKPSFDQRHNLKPAGDAEEFTEDAFEVLIMEIESRRFRVLTTKLTPVDTTSKTRTEEDGAVGYTANCVNSVPAYGSNISTFHHHRKLCAVPAEINDRNIPRMLVDGGSPM